MATFRRNRVTRRSEKLQFPADSLRTENVQSLNKLKTTLLVAQSIDGFITQHDSEGTSFCSDADFEFFIESLALFDCMIMGRATYELNRQTIQNAKAKKRLRKIATRTPEKWTSDTVPHSIEFSDNCPKTLLAELDERGYSRCAILGGTDIYTDYLKENLIDELWVTLEPHVFGTGKPLASTPIDLSFKLQSVEHLSSDTIVLKYKWSDATT